MISDLIHAFLNNFNYLNAKGKRSGCLFFSDTGLTSSLEKNARKVREDLAALAKNNDLSEEAKGDAFYTIVKNSFQSAELSRAEHGRPYSTRKAVPITMLDMDGISTSKNYWVKPRKPAKFEKQLVQGLNAVVVAATEELQVVMDRTDVLEGFQRKCQLLSDEISNYQRHDKCIANPVHAHHKRR